MISCFLCAIIIVGSDPPTLNPQTFGDRDPSTDAIHRVDRVAYMGLRDFSSALTRRELADDISNLPISGGQRQALINCAKEIYPAYLAEHDDAILHKGSKYLAIAHSLADQSNSTHENPAVEQIRKRSHEADALEYGLISTERNFIRSLQECFDGAMVDAGMSDREKDSIGGIILESLYLKADRRYSESFLPTPQRGTDLDLRSLVDQLKLEMPNRKSIEPDLLNYERSLSALKTALSKAFWGAALRTRILIDQSRAGQVDRATLAAQSKKIGAAHVSLGKQIRDVALDAAARIGSKLLSKQQLTFQQDVYRQLYPEIASDPKGDSLHTKFAEVLTKKDLSKDAADQIASLQSSWELEFNAWRFKAEASLIEWSDRGNALERGYVGESGKLKVEDILRLRDEIHEKWEGILENQIPKS